MDSDARGAVVDHRARSTRCAGLPLKAPRRRRCTGFIAAVLEVTWPPGATRGSDGLDHRAGRARETGPVWAAYVSVCIAYGPNFPLQNGACLKGKSVKIRAAILGWVLRDRCAYALRTKACAAHTELDFRARAGLLAHVRILLQAESLRG